MKRRTKEEDLNFNGRNRKARSMLIGFFLLSYLTFNALTTLARGNVDVVQIQVQGTVLDEKGQTLPGANISEKGTKNGITSDTNGNFKLTVSDKNSTLLVSFIGYITQEIPLAGRTKISVQLVPNAQNLGEVVVIGYGSTTKKDLVSSVASVSGETLQNQPTPRLDQALQGRAAGVEVTSNNGSPGAAATIRIRGASSINGNNNPLFVVDGFIAGSGFDLNNINVNDVKSIEVLKDATALSIYGTRGAAGVILITTKNGKGVPTGKPTVSLNHYTSVQSLANRVKRLSGQDYLDYKNEESQFVPGASGFGETDTSIPVAFPAGFDYANTDWVGLIERKGIVNNTDAAVSGNSENINYYVSLNHFDQKGVIKSSGLERYLLRANLGLDLSDKWKTGVNFNLSNTRTENNKVNFADVVFNLLPIRPVYNEDGSYNGVNPENARTQRNAVADINLRQDHTLQTNVVGNAYVEFKPIKELTIKSTFGTELGFVRGNQYLPGILPELKDANLGGSGTVNQNQARSWLNENTVTYKKTFNDHTLTVLAGATWQKEVNENTRMFAGGFVNDAVGFNNISLGSDAKTYQLTTGYVQRSYSSVLARIDYSYKSKYLLTLVGRRDGSSVFEEGNKFAFFPSIGAAWNMDEEKFIKNIEKISKLKLRASYGIVGEQGVAPYNSLTTFAGTNSYFNENLVNAVVIGALPSSNLSWETTRQIDLGLELGLFDQRITFEIDYYNKRTKDLLLERKVPGTVGSIQLQNIGMIENKGLEISLNTVNIKKADFSWETTIAVSGNRNKVVDLGGAAFIDLRIPNSNIPAGGTGIRLMPGQTVPTFVGARYLGTYKNKEEIIADGMTGQAFIGSPRYDDLDKNGVINENDKIVLGSPQPKFYGGLRNVFSYKRLTLDAFLQFSVGNEIFNSSNATAIFGRGEMNLSPKVVNRFIAGVNESSDIPRAGTSTNIFNPVSSLWIEDGSFLRLKSVSLSYNLPVERMNLNKLFKSANIYITGNNLFLLTNFTLGDPEVSNYGGSALEQGVAAGSYPYTTSITAGIKVDF